MGVAAARDKNLRAALLSVISEALRDEGFMAEMTSTMAEATVCAARNKELMDSCLQVIKIATTDAMRDSGFVSEITEAGMSVIRETLAESLKDGNIFRGAAGGVLSAINPWARPSRRIEKRQQERTVSKDSIPEETESFASDISNREFGSPVSAREPE